jgi:hypothetical protein
MDPKPTDSDGLVETLEVCDLEGILLEDLSCYYSSSDSRIIIPTV